MSPLLKACLFLLFYFECVSAVPYSEYIFASSTRDLKPVSVYASNGTVNNAVGVTNSGIGIATFEGVSHVTYDYGKEIAGIVSVTIANVSSSDATLTLTFAESSLYISSTSSDSTHDGGQTVPYYLNVGAGAGTYTMSRDYEFGGFRYLTVSQTTGATIEVSSVITNFTASPVNDLTAYTGYFHSDNELFNRIWYAGAYTNQLCIIDSNHGDAFDGWSVGNGLYNTSLNSTIAIGSSALVDGAKRDRVVWPGDLVISIPSIAVSFYDMQSIFNGVEMLLSMQLSNGMLPYYGWTYGKTTQPDISYTYHCHTMIDLIYYALWSGNQTALTSNWNKISLGISWSLSHIDDSGLLDVTSTSDWGRSDAEGHNIEANAILYYTLQLATKAAGQIRETASTTNWTTSAATLKAAANALLWDSSAGLYKDNENSTILPQDGNAWAVKANLTSNPSQIASISAALESRWNAYGAPAPEAPGIISPFISGFELEAHLLAGNASRALDLINLEWGYMLNNEYMTNSTMIEGYLTSGAPSYNLYKTASRTSHAHGWSTAPTFVMSTYIAGLKLNSSAGSTWTIEPQIGYLTNVTAGFSTTLGDFSIAIAADGVGNVGGVDFCTPSGTSGVFGLPGARGRFWNSAGSSSDYTRFQDTTTTLAGGCYSFRAS